MIHLFAFSWLDDAPDQRPRVKTVLVSLVFQTPKKCVKEDGSMNHVKQHTLKINTYIYIRVMSLSESFGYTQNSNSYPI